MEDRIKGFEAGADDFFSKSMDCEELSRKFSCRPATLSLFRLLAF